MNLTWEVILKAKQQNIDPHTLKFHPDFSGSPYRETVFDDMNLSELAETQVGINPLYRFSHIFGTLLDINESRYTQLREMLFDVFLHYQSQLDLRQGLTKSEYYIRAILRDLLGEVYGEKAAEVVALFSNEEAKSMLYGLLTMFRCGSSMELFRQVMRAIYPRGIVYRNGDVYREILIYLPQQKNRIEELRIEFLINGFLDINYTVYTFWGHHFGVIDLEETLEFDEMILF